MAQAGGGQQLPPVAAEGSGEGYTARIAPLLAANQVCCGRACARKPHARGHSCVALCAHSHPLPASPRLRLCMLRPVLASARRWARAHRSMNAPHPLGSCRIVQRSAGQ